MDKWYDAIKLRYSVRNYSSGISSQERVSLQRFADSISKRGIRIAVSRSDKVFSGKIFAPKITGTDCFAAVISQNGKDLFAGYIGEIFVLECVSRGFGTCWLGSSYKQTAAEGAVDLADGEEIACVISIGIPDEDEEKPPMRRTELGKLTDLSKEVLESLPEWQITALNAARSAPSAMNRQPWQFFVYEDAIGISNISRNLGYGMLDCGIAMIHAELGARHCGVNVDWDMKSRDDEAILFLAEADVDDETDDYDDEPDTDTEAPAETFDGDGFADEGDVSSADDDSTFN